MEYLNMKQAQSPPPKAYALHLLPTVQCPCHLQCALPQAAALLSAGCHGGTQQGRLRHRALINTH